MKNNYRQQLEDLLQSRSLKVCILLAPPRSGSTVLSAVLSRSSSVLTNVHEPSAIVRKTGDSDDWYKHVYDTILASGYPSEGDVVLIKEMSQWLFETHMFEQLASFASLPIIVLIRDPLLCAESRMIKMLETLYLKVNADLVLHLTAATGVVGPGEVSLMFQQSLLDDYAKQKGYNDGWLGMLSLCKINQAYSDALGECLQILIDIGKYKFLGSGWVDLVRQVNILDREGIDYRIVDFANVTSQPALYISEICRVLGIDYSADMLTWNEGDLSQFVINQTKPHQLIWYQNVRSSSGLRSPSRKSPSTIVFPAGIESYIIQSDIPAYIQLSSSKKRILFSEMFADGFVDAMANLQPSFVRGLEEWYLKNKI